MLSQSSIQTPVLNRFRDVRRLDFFGAFQIGDVHEEWNGNTGTFSFSTLGFLISEDDRQTFCGGTLGQASIARSRLQKENRVHDTRAGQEPAGLKG